GLPSTNPPNTQTQLASKAIAIALLKMLTQMERVTSAHDTLAEALPAHDEAVVEWDAVLGQIDTLGSAIVRCLTLAQDELVPAPRAVHTQALAAREEIAQLDGAFLTGAGITLPTSQPKLEPAETPAPTPDSWQRLLDAVKADTRLTETDRRVLAELVAL